MSNEQQNSLPYPGMREAFEVHYGQSFVDRDWRNESSVWAAAWKAAKSHNKKEQTLYTAPPMRDLSDEEILRVWDEESSKPLADPHGPIREQIQASEIALSRAIIKAAREKV